MRRMRAAKSKRRRVGREQGGGLPESDTRATGRFFSVISIVAVEGVLRIRYGWLGTRSSLGPQGSMTGVIEGGAHETHEGGEEQAATRGEGTRRGIA